MAETLRHRGPDDAGTWADSKFGIAFGHRRLSIIDLSAQGHQPMVSHCGRYVVCYNGEIYNFRALHAELAALGHAFRGHSDTEVMLAAFTQWGFEAALGRLNGMFALALWDRRDARLYLARDRLGEKPLYYGWTNGAFLFGSELKSLMAHPGFRKDIDRNALALYFRFNYVPSPHCIFQGVRKLPAGTYLALPADAASGSLPTPVPYWQVAQVAIQAARHPIREDEPELLERFAALLTDSVGLRMVADVPLGAFLSGGIDSSAIVAAMQAQSPHPVRTFTIGFHEAGFNEAHFAKSVAAHLGTDHTELYLTGPETLEVIPRLPEMYDEPFSDSSQIPTFLVSQLARRHVTVSLSGDGGDELFGGYNRYFLGHRIWSAVGLAPRALRLVAAAGLTALSPRSWNRLIAPGLRHLIPPVLARNPGGNAHKLAAVLRSRESMELYRQLVSHWTEPTMLVPGAVEPETVLSPGVLPAEVPEFRHRMMLADTLTYLPDDILVKVDRASMAVSLESRIPFLDHRMVELAWSVPAAQKFRHGGGKWLLKRYLARHLPASLIARPKMGFGIPVGEWLRGPLRDWAAALLDEQRLRREGYLDPEPIQARWRQHQDRTGEWGYLLWDVLMFEAWHDHYLGRS
jgi:asparagine synthase (glutamine-hydrolysing)